MASKKNLLIGCWIKTVTFTLPWHCCIQFLDHEAHGLELILKCWQMDKNKPLNKESSNLNITHIDLHSVQNCPESWANIGEALILAV